MSLGIKKLTPCKELSAWHKELLKHLARFAKTEYDPDFEVNFAEEIIAGDNMRVRGALKEGKQLWLDVHHSTTDDELLYYYGLPFSFYLRKIGLIEGEQYFVALLHEIGHANVGLDECEANKWAKAEFEKKRKVIREIVTS